MKEQNTFLLHMKYSSYSWKFILWCGQAQLLYKWVWVGEIGVRQSVAAAVSCHLKMMQMGNTFLHILLRVNLHLHIFADDGNFSGGAQISIGFWQLPNISYEAPTSTGHWGYFLLFQISETPIFVPGVWGPYFSAMVPGLWLNEGGQSATGKLVSAWKHRARDGSWLQSSEIASLPIQPVLCLKLPCKIGGESSKQLVGCYALTACAFPFW